MSSRVGVMAEEDHFRDWLRQVETKLARRCGLSHDECLANERWLGEIA